MGELWLNGISYSGGGGADVEITGEASGAIASFADGSANPLKSLKISIEQGENGWTGADITVTGKNLLDGLQFAENIRDYGYNVTLNTTDKYVRYTRGVINPDTGQYIQTLFKANFKADVQYTVIFSYSNAGNNSSILFEYTDETRQQITLENSNNQKQVYAQTSSANKTLKRIVLSFYGDATTDLYYEESGLFEGVLTAQDFEPYVGTNYSISWQTEAGEISEGELDVTNGVLTVTGGSTYQITPTEVDSQLGYNNIWANTGDSEVIYIRDIDKAFNILWNAVMNSNSGTRSLNLMKGAISEETKEDIEEPIKEEEETKEGNDENKR